MNKLLETFLTSIAAITVYKLLTAMFNAYRYRQDEIDTPINTFNEYDHADLKRIVAEVSE
ncbi:hypothetical protein NTB88_21970 [Aeromonas salmonicida]|nr:hypothetical protein [Aeromonas salmonicida]